VDYAGPELVAMAEARNYYRWILGRCRGQIGRVVLEHGAGIGTLSELLLTESIEKLLVLEPAENLLPALRARLTSWGDRVEVIGSTLEDAVDHLQSRAIDTVISVNVLEHIERDVATLQAMWKILIDGGRVMVFVPALPWLYGSMDRTFGHVRRYRKEELCGKLRQSGFEVVECRFFNLLGIASWAFTGRILRRPTLDPAMVRFYDRFVIPVVSRVETLSRPPIGQNLLVVARKARQS
jgi:SAM-dependent methyltransferase